MSREVLDKDVYPDPNFIPMLNEPIEFYCPGLDRMSLECIFNIFNEVVKVDLDHQEDFKRKKKLNDFDDNYHDTDDMYYHGDISSFLEKKETDTTKITAEKNHINILKKHSLSYQCISSNYDAPLIDMLLVNTYGNIDKYQYKKELHKIAQSSQVLYEVLAVNAVLSSLNKPLQITAPLKKQDKLDLIDEVYKAPQKFTINTKKHSALYESPTSITHVGDNITEYDLETGSNTAGYYRDSNNRIIVTNENDSRGIKYNFLFHEMTHNLIQKIFKNDSLPYKDNKFHLIFGGDKPKDLLAFEQVKIEMFKYIQNIFKENFNLTIAFEDENDSYKMGKSIADLIFSNNLNKNNILDFIDIFKKNDLDIDQYHQWLGTRAFTLVMSNFDKEMADIFMQESNAKFDSIALVIAAIDSRKDLLEWFFDNTDEYDINTITCRGKTAVSFATDPEIISLLISAGANPYDVINYQDTCKRCEVLDDDGSEKLVQLDQVKDLLGSYLKSYSKASEDAEIIARFVQVLSFIDDNKIMALTSSFEAYWEKFISPEIEYYLRDFGFDNVCLPLVDEYSLYQDLFV